jgi:hypothetical protein
LSGSGPDSEIPDFFPQAVRRGVVDANLIAQRLDRIVREMGEGISETLYRRTREAVLRGNHDLIISDADNSSVVRHLMGYIPPARGVSPRASSGGLPENPRDLHSWWSGLSEDEKQELFRTDPFIGNRDGIPQAERDFYNRQNLQHLWERAHIERDNERIRYYDEIKNMLDQRKIGEPTYFLSYLGEDGRYAIALDNPDLADNSVVFLKPAGSVYSVDFAQETMEQIRQSAVLVDPNSRTSVTFWGNYDNPSSMVETMFPQFATDGAAAVRSYHDGLRVTHQGPPAHTTTIGYSYGGVLAGHAAGHGFTLDTDEMIFIGSWGTGVDHVCDLSLAGVEPGRTADHVFATLAPRDPLQFMPDTHGPMPTDPEFGAFAFAAGSAPDISGWNLLDHDVQNYLSSGNPSSRSIGLIVTGHGDQVARLS